MSNTIRYRHIKWGEGILQKVEGTVLILEFPQVGVKKLTTDSISKGILTRVLEGETNTKTSSILSHQDGNLRQYDTSDTVIGGKNILEAFDSNDIVVFNESYTIVGDETTAKKISATYDLTIIGDLSVDEIKVNGTLTVIGDVSARVLTCANTFICRGHVNVDSLYVGSIVAKSVKCVEFVCDGNALIETTIDIDELSRTEKTMVACEGIMGAGSFAALNAIANEYFEFSGDVQGKVLELESDTTLSEVLTPVKTGVDLSEMPVDDMIRQIGERLQVEYKKCEELEEDALLELIQHLSSNSFSSLSDYATLFDALVNISYLNEIVDFGDYLTVMYAKKVLPTEIYRYETIEHIDSMLLPKAQDMLDELEFRPQSVERIAQCIKMAIECADSIPMSTDYVLDKVFTSFGLRYSTVKNILEKTSANVSVKEKPATEAVVKTVVEEPVSKTTPDEVGVGAPKPPKKSQMSKSEFLEMSLHTEAKYFGITNDEQMRLASAKVKTCGDFLRMSESAIRDIFKKKLFLANHLFQAQKKMKAAVDKMDDE